MSSPLGGPTGYYRSFAFPVEDGYDSDLAEDNKVVIDDLDSDASDSSDVDFDPASDSESDISDTELERAEQIDQEYFNPSLKDRIISRLPNVSTAIIGALFVGSALYYRGLPSENQAKEAGYNDGLQQGMQATHHALAYIEHFARQNVLSLFTKNLNL